MNGRKGGGGEKGGKAHSTKFSPPKFETFYCLLAEWNGTIRATEVLKLKRIAVKLLSNCFSNIILLLAKCNNAIEEASV